MCVNIVLDMIMVRIKKGLWFFFYQVVSFTVLNFLKSGRLLTAAILSLL